MIKGKQILLLTILLAACVIRCGSPLAGGATDSPNSRLAKVKGTAMYGKDSVAAEVEVRMRPSDFAARPHADTLHGATALTGYIKTRSDGTFEIDSVDTGSYFLELNDRKGFASGMQVTVSDDTVLPSSKLEAVVAISGTVTLDGIPSGTPAAVQVIGLDRVALADQADGTFTFDDLPSGSFRLRAFALSVPSAVVETTVGPIAPGNSVGSVLLQVAPFTVENYSDWLHSRPIDLNTTETGAGISEDIHNFPVLIRLDAGSIDFSQTQPVGADIRFSRANGIVRLPYEIESWDSNKKQAAIWVLVDTIKALDTTRIYIHWGNDRAHSFSHGPAVFDSAFGFAGVWHMNATDTIIDDATPYKNHGSAEYYPPESLTVDGIIGKATGTGGMFHAITVPDAPELRASTAFTISVWFKGMQYGDLVNKAKDYTLYPHGPEGSVELLFNDAHYVSGNGVPLPEEWNYCAVSYDGFDFFWRTNGTFSTAPLPYSGTVVPGNESLLIQQTYIPVDEVRIERVTRNQAWLKLCYENQKASQVFVQW